MPDTHTHNSRTEFGKPINTQAATNGMVCIDKIICLLSNLSLSPLCLSLSFFVSICLYFSLSLSLSRSLHFSLFYLSFFVYFRAHLMPRPSYLWLDERQCFHFCQQPETHKGDRMIYANIFSPILNHWENNCHGAFSNQTLESWCKILPKRTEKKPLIFYCPWEMLE